ncbi:hypothetical protein Bca52824_061350 [Brassica carinata]|uniref:Uncharacterized protein n=1 Tax=Brassica carinata TaxID=52824 RepID=A0A8X7QYA9_BRACI|nr:hypothetical protein Bca52824_061350 [Brassica carinata]
MSSSNSLLLFFSVLFALIFSLANSDIEVDYVLVRPRIIYHNCVMLDVVRIGDRRYVLEHAEHVVSGANVYHPARMETERSVADVTQI